ncbi:WD domain, G-beta repeat protein [Ancylostoma caninum]|uniref:WD domain, G-beta repeat protein n=1 Tax=Ancylostoma caninum TaxID=29170 RepID=A0A368FTD5_ANCCA|nr:WD domain, G-beta repeat protein [Ancylostoma caninum]
MGIDPGGIGGHRAGEHKSQCDVLRHETGSFTYIRIWPPQSGPPSTKVKVPGNTNLACVEWNLNTNFLASGGSGGMLKVIKLTHEDSVVGSTMNMPVNQALEGHSGYVAYQVANFILGTVMCAAWNEVHQKLTTSDSNGLIIVWSLHNETWYEEMINNRNKSVVVGMAWNYDGTKIAIAYQDGQVIVGTMDGNRIWNKELNGNVATCEWSPNGNLLLFGMGDGEVHTYDAQGVFMEKLHMVALENVELETALAKDLRKDNIIAIKWFAPAPKSRVSEDNSPIMSRLPRVQSLESLTYTSDFRPDPKPKLLIAYAHGVVQLMRNENDSSPIVARFPQLTVTCARWCPNGNFFAVTGQQLDMPTQESSVVHVVTAYGVKLSSLQMHCSSLTGCSWDPTGVKLALCAENLIWFANVRPRYKWGYCGHTVVYSFERVDRGDYRVVFYESKLDESYSKPVRQLEQLATGQDYCIIANRQEDSLGKVSLGYTVSGNCKKKNGPT